MEEARLNNEGPAFKEIEYKGVKEINYLDDIGAMGTRYVSFLESLNHSLASENKQTSSYFDNTIDELYKKIVKQGYVDKPSKVSRKLKKGQSDVNFYNQSDQFIDDQECCVEKKDKTTTFEDYGSVAATSIQELYASPMYAKKLEDLVVEAGKRKAGQQFTLVEDHQIEKFDSIKKNIADKILSRTKNISSDDNENVEKKDDKAKQSEKPAQQIHKAQEEKIQIKPIVVEKDMVEKQVEPKVIVTPPPQQGNKNN